MEQTFIRQNYRIYPSKDQVNFLNQDMGNQRFVWNYFIAKSIERYELEKKFYFYNESAALLKPLKEEFPFLKLGGSQCIQQTLRQLDVALKGCFKSANNKKGFPKFKFRSYTGSICYPQSVKIIDGKLDLPKFKELICINGKGLPEDFNSVTITRSASGKFFASFVVPFSIPDKVEITKDSTSVGIDLNSRHIVVLSNGQAVVNPKHLLKKEKKLKKYQKQFSRKVKGSKNKEKARLKLAKLHEKVANARKDFIDQLTTQIVNSFDIISIEDLNVKGMQRWNGRMVQSAPFGMIRSKLEWKAKREGKHLVVIGRYIPSSKACSDCGQLHNLGLKDRHFSCDCGLELHRDHNAAINILNVGLSDLGVGTTLSACGETKVHDSRNGIRWVSLKQENTLFLEY
jgi:putative transposase